jgi:hypothetical protein
MIRLRDRIVPPALPSLVLLALLAAALPFSGCQGGTSVDAGNPGLVVGFRQGGEPADFQGYVRAFASDSNPGFYAPAPAGAVPGKVESNPVITVGGGTWGNIVLYMGSNGTVFLRREFLEEGSGYRVDIPLLPRHFPDVQHAMPVPGAVGLDPDRPFNLLFEDNREPGLGIAMRVAYDAALNRYRDQDGALLDTLWVDLHPPGGYTGIIDTAGLGETPLVLFAPGLPFHARLRGDRFHLGELPPGRLTVRLLTAGGSVLSFPEPLLVTGTREDSLPDSRPPLAPGNPVDTVAMPVMPAILMAPVADPPGPYEFTGDTLYVTLEAEDGTVIYYTADETEPGLHSRRYERPIAVTRHTILKAVAHGTGAYPSPVSANEYIKVLPVPQARPEGQAFRDSIRVELATPARNAGIRYTLDGSEPTAASQVYLGPLVLRATATLKAVTWVEGLRPSRVLEQRYILLPDTLSAVLQPVAAPAPAAFADSMVVALSSPTPQARIHYTLDGSTPSAMSALYEAPLVLRATTTLRAVAILSDGSASEEFTGVYTQGP